jgi:P27 family predicted phage terminase small subunit
MNVQIMIEAHLDIQENGLMIWGARGKIRNPALSAFASATQNMRAWASEFGMTPSARSRIHLPGDDENDNLKDILGTVVEEDAE